jgi:hypothetical protein
MNDVNGLVRLEAALNRYSSFRTFAKKVSSPHLNRLVLPKDWKPFYLKSATVSSAVRLHDGQTLEVLDLKEKFANSRFYIYSKLISNFYDSDCGCEGTGE